MKLHSLALNTLILALILATPSIFAQTPAFENAAMNAAPAGVGVASDSTGSSSSFVIVSPRPHEPGRNYRPFSEMGLATRAGLAGTGFDVATPLGAKFNLRAGADFFSYATSFQEEGANVGINLHLRSGHAALDWFPFGGHLRLSPQVVFGNNNRIFGDCDYSLRKHRYAERPGLYQQCDRSTAWVGAHRFSQGLSGN
jgi:hypothetical protein